MFLLRNIDISVWEIKDFVNYYHEIENTLNPLTLMICHLFTVFCFGLWMYFIRKGINSDRIWHIKSLAKRKPLVITGVCVACGVCMCFLANGVIMIEAVTFPSLIDDYLKMAQNAGFGTHPFAIFAAISSFGIGCTVQANAIATVTQETFGLSPYIIGILLCILTGAVVLGGIKSIARVCTAIVPFMAAVYIIGCFVIIGINFEYVWPAIKLIIVSAVSPESIGGGFLGGSIMLACRYGIARGLFSNESGMGSAPIMAATAQTRNPVRQALVSSSGTFWDTVVICALTGVVIVSSIIAYPDIDYHDGGTLTKLAFSKIPYIGAPILTFGLLSFAFSTILGWEVYGERSINYLNIKKSTIVYRILYVAMVFFGSVMNLELVWNISDCFNALMTIPNLLSLIFLSGVIVKETRKYLWNNNLDAE